MADRLLRIEILGEAKSAVAAFRETEGASTGLSGKFAGLGKAAGVLAGAAGLAMVVDGLKKCTEAAIKDQQATAKFDAAVKATHGNLETWSGDLQKARDKGRDLGFTNVDVTDGLRRFVTAGDNMAQAARDMATAEDLARVKHISLAEAANQVVKLHAGATRLLKEFGEQAIKVSTNTDALKAKYAELNEKVPPLELAHARLADKMASAAANADLVAQKVKGQADAYSQTAEGGMATFAAQLDNVQTKIGDKLLPVFDRLLSWVNQHWPEISSAIDTACKVAGKAIELVKPIIVLMGTTVANMAKLVKAVLTGDWSAAWSAAKAQFSAVWEYTRTSLNNLINLIRGPVTAAWNAIKGVVSGVWSAVKSTTESIFFPIYNRIKSAFEWIRDNAAKCWDAIASAVNAVWKGIKTVLDTMAAAIDRVKDALQKLKDLASTIGDAISGAVGGGVPFIPGFAEGGPVPANRLAIVGEKGPELFVPSTAGTIIPSDKTAALMGRGGGVNLHVHFSGTVMGGNERAICDRLATEMYSSLRRLRTAGLPALT